MKRYFYTLASPILKIFALNCCLVIITSLSAQEWSRSYNGPANQFDAVRAMVVDDQNNIYVTGPSEVKRGNIDIVTIKYSPIGQQLWVARYNGTGNDEDWPYAISVKNGHVYVTGRSTGISNNYDIATIKLNAVNGNQEWVVRYDNLGMEVGNDVVADNNGNVFITGFSNGTGVVTGKTITTIKYDSDGNLLWVENYEGFKDDKAEYGHSLALDGTGNIYVTGLSNGHITLKYNDQLPSPSLEWVRAYSQGGSGRKVLIDGTGNIVVCSWGIGSLIKYSPDGTILWESSSYGSSDYTAWDMCLDDLDNIYITGHYSAPDGTNDFGTKKFDAAGNLQWFKTHNTAPGARDHARSISVDNNGNCYATGFTNYSSGKRTTINAMLTIKYDQSGNQTPFQFDSVSDGFAVATDNENNFVVAGQHSVQRQGNNFLTVKYSASEALKKAITLSPSKDDLNKKLRENIRIAPVPVKDILQVHYKGHGDQLTYRIYSVSSNLLITEGTFTNSARINLSNQRMGNYIINIFSRTTGAELKQLFIKE